MVSFRITLLILAWLSWWDGCACRVRSLKGLRPVEGQVGLEALTVEDSRPEPTVNLSEQDSEQSGGGTSIDMGA